jgi:hypothetical protein
VAIGWVDPGQATKQPLRWLAAIADGATLEIPALWPLEVANALLVLVRRRKLTEDERQARICSVPRRARLAEVARELARTGRPARRPSVVCVVRIADMPHARGALVGGGVREPPSIAVVVGR